jgi:glycogen(starch) synthase
MSRAPSSASNNSRSLVPTATGQFQMKVLAFTPQYLPVLGGIEIFVDELSEALRHRSIETVVVTARDHRNQLPVRDIVNNTIVHRLDFLRALQLGGATGPLEILHQLVKLVEAERPDLLHVHSALCSAPWYVHRLLRKLAFRLPFIVTEHTLLQPSECLEVVRRLLLRADALTGVSRSVLQSVIELTGREGHSTVIYNGVQGIGREDDVPVRSDRAGLKHRLICVGRLQHEKGFDLAIAALAKVRSMGFDAELTVIGDGDDRDFLRQAAVDHAIAGHISFKGALDHASTLAAMASSSLVLIPSRPREGFSLVAVEAAHSGVPRIASRVGGLEETIEDGVSGLLVAPDSADGLASAIIELLSNEQYARTLSANARRIACEKFSMDTCVEAYVELYRCFEDRTK